MRVEVVVMVVEMMGKLGGPVEAEGRRKGIVVKWGLDYREAVRANGKEVNSKQKLSPARSKEQQQRQFAEKRGETRQSTRNWSNPSRPGKPTLLTYTSFS